MLNTAKFRIKSFLLLVGKKMCVCVCFSRKGKINLCISAQTYLHQSDEF